MSVLHLPQHECGVHQTRNPMGTFGCQAACLTAEDRFHLVLRVIMRGAVVTFHHMSLMSLCSTKHRHAFTLPFDESFSDNKLFCYLFRYCKGYIKSDPLTAWIIIAIVCNCWQTVHPSLGYLKFPCYLCGTLNDEPNVSRHIGSRPHYGPEID